MDKAAIIDIVKWIVANLVEKRYDVVVENDAGKLITVEEMRSELEEYPGAISMPPDSAFEKMDFYVVNDKRIRIDMDLWYDGKRSDLTLSGDFRDDNGRIDYIVEGIHIL